jgi:hypothetical protein
MREQDLERFDATRDAVTNFVDAADSASAQLC